MQVEKYGKINVNEIPGWLHGLDWNSKDTVDKEWWAEMYHPCLDRLDAKLRAAEELYTQCRFLIQDLGHIGYIRLSLEPRCDEYEKAGDPDDR